MAIQKQTLIPVVPSRRSITGGAAPSSTPFRVYVMAVDNSNQTADIRISRYSAVLSTLDINDRLPIIGIDLKLNIEYGDKVWLEIYYDRNLSPVFALINTGPKWTATVVNPGQSNANQTTAIYPKEHEFIVKQDISSKLTELDDVIALVATYKTAATDELGYRKNVGIITETQHTELIEAVDEQYQNVENLIKEYKKNMNKFFESAPTSVWRKLFRTYTLVAYTTHEPNLDLEGTSVDPTPPAATETPDVPTATDQISYRIVQCLNTDLYLADMCYQNRYPAKLPVPYHRPVYRFEEEGKIEDDVNTNIT